MTAPSSTDRAPNARGTILNFLKREPEASLARIAQELGTSKVAALRHLALLEEQGLVERVAVRSEGVGRPPARFKLTPQAAALFPQAYTSMALCSLAFIERRLGREGVVALLRERAREIREEHGARFKDRPLPGRVRELVRLRDEGGYMAEMGPRRGTTFEVREHNCPIMALAETYGEACEEERRLFTQLLKAKVDVTHRVVAGAPMCRFLIRPSEGPP